MYIDGKYFINKEIMDSLCFLRDCALKDNEHTTQLAAFKQVYEYIEKSEKDNAILKIKLKEKDEVIENLKKDLKLIVEYGQDEDASNWEKQYGECAKETLRVISKLERGKNGK